MPNIHILIPLVMAVAMIAVVTIASGYPYLQAKLSIIFSGGLVLVLALVQLVRELRPAKQQADEPKTEHEVHKHSASLALYGIELAWMVGFGLTIYLLGFIVAIPLYICAYMKSHGSRWRASIMTGVLMSAFCYGIFVLILEMKLHSGVIFMHLGF
jgi:hypothetical protein